MVCSSIEIKFMFLTIGFSVFYFVYFENSSYSDVRKQRHSAVVGIIVCLVLRSERICDL